MWAVFKLDETQAATKASELVSQILQDPNDRHCYTQLAQLFTDYVTDYPSTGRMYSQALKEDDAHLRVDKEKHAIWLEYSQGWTLFLGTELIKVESG